ncbi:hypothetical protein AMS68_004581 [Peltaster fructicola]|uniref:Protein arginine N-methyltransferase n=1 Tax=Peltaster fructicola TaxID=286661 RepID=A0A6H0XWG0_9PEZI|nr:hypothetical protein AMS68_004581 [Peltaster fructicola]
MSAMTTEDVTPLWFVAEHDSSRADIEAIDALTATQELGYDMVTIPITTSLFHGRVFSLLKTFFDSKDRQTFTQLQPLGSEDTLLVPDDANGRLIGLISPWIVPGARDATIADVSQQVLKLEFAYASFCGILNVIIHGPLPGSDVVQYARCVLEGLAANPHLNIRIALPMTGELQQDDLIEESLLELDLTHDEDEAEDGTEQDLYGTWQTWDTIRAICNYHSRLGVALEIPRQLPAMQLQSRWYSEPIRIINFPRTSFLRNAKGYPVLHRSHQEYLTRLQRLRIPPWIMLSDVADRSPNKQTSDPTPAEASQKMKHRAGHLEYIRHLQQTQPARSAIERFGQGYQDYMQSPLQPLSDNLESITYEVFEKDPVKYDWYEQATELALLDLRARLGDDRPLNVAVVGSGRGPLVSKALLASQNSGVAIRCWAVEKNPNAFVHLQRRNRTDPLWNGTVTVVKSDMRAWKGPVIDGKVEKLDVMISELLGSFADNELSPECLDGVQHVLHSEHGVNIPQSYTAHLTPISTPRLYNELLLRFGDDKWEVPVVVMLQQQDFLSLQQGSSSQPNVQTAWEFHHPIDAALLERQQLRAGGSVEHGGTGGAFGGDGSNEHNNRYCKVSFDVKEPGVCHGLAGYFETVLYASDDGKKVELSTNPVTIDAKSKDMISWFPIFFPLKVSLSMLC